MCGDSDTFLKSISDLVVVYGKRTQAHSAVGKNQKAHVSRARLLLCCQSNSNRHASRTQFVCITKE